MTMYEKYCQLNNEMRASFIMQYAPDFHKFQKSFGDINNNMYITIEKGFIT